jgi:hypothetical protein
VPLGNYISAPQPQFHPLQDENMSTINEKDTAKAVEEVSIASGHGSPEPIDKVTERKLVMKIDWRLLPILFLLLMAAFLDRINIGNARIMGLEKDLHMKGNDFNIALFVFFIPYILLEVPSNLLMKRIRPSMWLSGLIFGWGRSHALTSPCDFANPSCRRHHHLSRPYAKLRRPCCLPCLDRYLRGWLLPW